MVFFSFFMRLTVHPSLLRGLSLSWTSRGSVKRKRFTWTSASRTSWRRSWRTTASTSTRGKRSLLSTLRFGFGDFVQLTGFSARSSSWFPVRLTWCTSWSPTSNTSPSTKPSWRMNGTGASRTPRRAARHNRLPQRRGWCSLLLSFRLLQQHRFCPSCGNEASSFVFFIFSWWHSTAYDICCSEMIRWGTGCLILKESHVNLYQKLWTISYFQIERIFFLHDHSWQQRIFSLFLIIITNMCLFL